MRHISESIIGKKGSAFIRDIRELRPWDIVKTRDNTAWLYMTKDILDKYQIEIPAYVYFSDPKNYKNGMLLYFTWRDAYTYVIIDVSDYKNWKYDKPSPEYCGSGIYPENKSSNYDIVEVYRPDDEMIESFRPKQHNVYDIVELVRALDKYVNKCKRVL